MSDLVRLTGLWKGQMKNGQSYLSGSLGSARLVIFPNDKKDGEKSPDFIVYMSPQKAKEGETKPADNGFDF